MRISLLLLALLPLTSACRTTGDSSKSAALSDSVGTAPADHLGLFCETYEDCRAQFRAEAGRQGANLAGFKLWNAPLPEAAAADGLTVDFAYFPAATNPSAKLLVLTSGIHGIEGYTGSTLQALFCQTMLQDTLAAGVSVLMVHGINAYGFKYFSRYTENRVDLNRNWFLTDTFPPSQQDQLYDKFATLFNPTGVAAFSDSDFSWFVGTKMLPWIRSVEKGTLTQAAGQGQYRYPQGIIYGGQAYEPHHQIFLDNAGPYLASAGLVMHFDLHTGLGRREMQLLPNPPLTPAIDALRKQVFEADGLSIEATGNETFYSSFGDFSDFVCGYSAAQGAGHRCVNMLMEYGTLIETYWQKWPLGLGVLKTDIAEAFTLYLTIRENQMFRYGPKNAADQRYLISSYHDLFYPTDATWRTMVLTETANKWPLFLARFEAL